MPRTQPIDSLPSVLVNRLVLNLRQFEPSGRQLATSRTWWTPCPIPALDEQELPHIRIVPAQPTDITTLEHGPGDLHTMPCLSHAESEAATVTSNTGTALSAMGYSLPIALTFDGEQEDHAMTRERDE